MPYTNDEYQVSRSVFKTLNCISLLQVLALMESMDILVCVLLATQDLLVVRCVDKVVFLSIFILADGS